MNKGKITGANNTQMIITIIFITLLIVLIGIITYSIYLYQGIQSSKTSDLNKTKSALIKDGKITDVDEMYDFYDEKSYHIFKGKNNEGKQHFIFVPINNDGEEIVVNIDKIISKQQAANYGTENCQQCDIIKVSPAMIDELALWEVIYFDDKNRYVIDYLSMEEGTRIEQLRLASKYKD